MTFLESQGDDGETVSGEGGGEIVSRGCPFFHGDTFSALGEDAYGYGFGAGPQQVWLEQEQQKQADRPGDNSHSLPGKRWEDENEARSNP